jgi:hypothetical protein
MRRVMEAHHPLQGFLLEYVTQSSRGRVQGSPSQQGALLSAAATDGWLTERVGEHRAALRGLLASSGCHLAGGMKPHNWHMRSCRCLVLLGLLHCIALGA